MSAWREQLRPASFRGVAFHALGHELTSGRRIALHQYPQRDLPYAEDLGRRAETLAVEGVVLGANYFAARDELRAALDAPGPGQLVHPWYGVRDVVVDEYRLRETTREGGAAFFSVSFLESGVNQHPTDDVDTASVVRTDADVAEAAVGAAFESSLVTSGPEWLRDGIRSVLALAGETIGAIPTRHTLTTAAGSALGEQTDALAAASTTLVTSPPTMLSTLTTSLGLVRTGAQSAADAVQALRGLFDFGASLPSVPLTTATRRTQSANQSLLVSTVRQSALIEASRAASSMAFESRDQAAAIRDELAEAIDAEQLDAADDVYQVLGQLRASLIKDITRRGADLAVLAEVTMPATLPALVVAHRLYGDAARADAIVARNRQIRHPGFVGGGSALEVLTDG